jgi:TIR domain/Tetratricopeptide repeat
MAESRGQVFVSYSHADAGEVRPVAQALRDVGLDVWIDEKRIEEFESIQNGIENGLAGSSAMLAWYSTGYGGSRACEWELTAAFMAAQHEGDVRKRVLVVNPERSNAHIYPVELRDSLYMAAPQTPDEVQTTARMIGTHVSSLSGLIGAIRALQQPEWHGGSGGYGSNRFVGRVQELWRVHSGLQSRALPIITGAMARPLVRLTGIAGGGKSLLAEEYGLRFGAAYPGGVFWLRAFGHDRVKGPLDDREREAERHRQFAAIAVSLGVQTEGLTPERVQNGLTYELDSRGAYLWVIDDLPSSLSWDAASAWMAPTQRGHTLVTTRAGADHWAGTTVEVDELEPDAAYVLLTSRRPPRDEQEKAEAVGLVSDLGGHALGLELAAALAERRDYVDVRRRLADRSKDVLDFAAKLFGVSKETLPQREGANLNIAQTLSSSIEELSDVGMDFLRLAAQLAPVPISRELVVRAFAATDRLSKSDAEDQADLAVADVQGRALARATAGTAVQVHTLVSRTIRFRSDSKGRDRQIRLGALQALNDIQASESWTTADVEHSRTLALVLMDERTTLDRDEARQSVRLLEGLSRSDVTLYVDRAYGQRMRQNIFEISEQVLGKRDKSTLFALNELALMHFAFGELAIARKLQERLVELARAALGPDDPDTNVVTANLLETLQAIGDDTAAQALQKSMPPTLRWGSFRRTPP